MKYKILIFALAVVFTSSVSSASETRHDNLESLDGSIRYGLKNSSSIRAAFEAYTAATYRSPQVSSLPDPKLSYAYFINSVETRVGPQNHKIGLAQSFPWFGTLNLKGKKANAEARAEFNRFLALKNRLVLRVTEAYVELAYVDASIKVTKDTIELVRSWENVLRERFRTATGSHSDLIRVQVELGKLEDRLSELGDLRHPLSSTLNSVINREQDFAVSASANFLSDHAKIASAIVTIDDVSQGNPELLMLSAAIEAKELGVDLAEKKFYPDFTVGLDYIVTGDRDVSGGGEDSVLGMVSINLPLYLEKNRAAVHQAKANRRSFEQLKRDKEFELRSELSRANFDLRDSERKLSLYRDTLIPKSRESIEASYTAYQAGDASFLDVIDSEQRLLEFRLILRRAQANKIIANAKLQEISGGFSQVGGRHEDS